MREASGKYGALTGTKLERAFDEMKMPCFLERLMASVDYQAKRMGLSYETEKGDMVLPGSTSVGEIAMIIIHKALNGDIFWDESKFQTFYDFCSSRTQSVLSSTLKNYQRSEPQSPIPQVNASSEEGVRETDISAARAPNDVYEEVLLSEDSERGNAFLQDFALSLDDESNEQLIAMAILDDRECVSRKYCIEKLNLKDADYDSALKRLHRRLPKFRKQWVADNQVSEDEWRNTK